MQIAFAIIAALTIISAIAAVSLPNLIHCALSLFVTFGGLAALYLLLGAQFVGLAQLLVYVGAVAIVIVFAILLTRGGGERTGPIFSTGRLVGIAIAALVFVILAYAIFAGAGPIRSPAPPTGISVGRLGEVLMTEDVFALEAVGLLLTTALIGAAVIALRDEPVKK